MAHVLIVGTTESGKTTLAKKLAQHYKQAGTGILVLDPLMDPAWNADFITDDQEKFLAVFWNSRQCVAFMDEGGESVGKYNHAMQKTVTRGRHWGHSCHIIAQRATQLAPIVRDMCSSLFVFRVSKMDAETLAGDYTREELLNAHTLQQGDFIHVSRFGPVIYGNVFGKPYGGKKHDPGIIDSRRSGGSGGPDPGPEEENRSEIGNGNAAEGDERPTTG